MGSAAGERGEETQCGGGSATPDLWSMANTAATNSPGGGESPGVGADAPSPAVRRAHSSLATRVATRAPSAITLRAATLRDGRDEVADSRQQVGVVGKRSHQRNPQAWAGGYHRL